MMQDGAGIAVSDMDGCLADLGGWLTLAEESLQQLHDRVPQDGFSRGPDSNRTDPRQKQGIVSRTQDSTLQYRTDRHASRFRDSTICRVSVAPNLLISWP